MHAPLVSALLLSLVFVALATPADASIYRYELEDGTVLFTTEPQRGMQPAAVYGTDGRARPAPRGERRTSDITPPDRPNPNPRRNPDAFDDLIREASVAYGIPFAFIKAVIRVESAFDPHAVSPAGAQGLMQLMPRTAASLNCEDPFDPRQNIMAGTQYLRILADRYDQDINRILAAYNAGSGTVARYDGIPYESTRRYIQRVYQFYQDYLAAEQEMRQAQEP